MSNTRQANGTIISKSNSVAPTTMCFLAVLPKDILKAIFKYLTEIQNVSPRDIRNFARTCGFKYEIQNPSNPRQQITTRAYFSVFKPEFERYQFMYALVLIPNPDMVKNLAKKQPKLLTEVIPEVIVNGTKYTNYQPYSLVQMAFDERVSLALKEALTLSLGSEDAAIKEMNDQIAKRLNQDPVEIEKIQNKLTLLLDNVTPNITNAKISRKDGEIKYTVDEGTLEEIKIFRVELKKLFDEIAEKGMPILLEMIQQILDVYARVAQQWNYDHAKCALFEDGVLAPSYERLPINIAQDCTQGLYYLQKDKSTVRLASLILQYSKINFYDRLKSPSADFVGLVGSCIDIHCVGEGGRRWPWSRVFQTLCRTKTSSLQNLRGNIQIGNQPGAR